LEKWPNQGDGADGSVVHAMDVYEVRSRTDKRGVNVISDALPFGGLWYTKPEDAVDYAKFFSRSHNAVIRVYDAAGAVIEVREHTTGLALRDRSGASGGF